MNDDFSINVPISIQKIITLLAKRDGVSSETKVIDLLQLGVEIEEDELWNTIASKRDLPDAEYILHQDVW